MYRAILSSLSVLLAFAFLSRAQGQNAAEDNYDCYSGGVTEKSAQIQEVRLGLSKSADYASTILFVQSRKRIGNDAFCAVDGIGPCSISDDGGHFNIVGFDDKSLTLELEGRPVVVTVGHDKWPRIVNDGGRTARVRRLNLLRVEKSLCDYTN